MKKFITALIILTAASAIAFTAFGCTVVPAGSDIYSDGLSSGEVLEAEVSDSLSGKSESGEANELQTEGEAVQSVGEANIGYAYYASATASVNVRKSASTSGTVLGKMDKGDLLAYVSTENDWRKVYYCGAAAYVSAEYTELYQIRADGEYESVISVAEKLLGTPYVYGAARLMNSNGTFLSSFSLNAFDCSSFVQYAFYYGIGVKLDVTSRLQSVQGVFCDKSDIERGTVLFFTNSGRYYKSGVERIGHVGIYFGDGYILHTASDYAVIEKISATRWSYFVTAKNI